MNLKRMTKGKAFALCLASVMFIFTAMFVLGMVKKELDVIPVKVCLQAIGALAGLYITGSVADNGVKGHNWCQAMYDSEKPKTEAGVKK